MQFTLVGRDGHRTIVVVTDEGDMLTADEQHPLFDTIVEKAVANDESVVDDFDSSIRAAEVFERLTDRVTVANSRVYVDQSEVEDVFADTLVEFLDENVDDEDRQALVNFLEKVYSNVDVDIRENLSRWLKAEQFTILPNGNILGYRGLREDFTSVHAGPGIVNGERVNGNLDNSVGNVVEIDVDKVEVDPARGCASGLHVGTYNYATGWSRGQLVSVEVDPRHVRSVPYESGDSKMRVSQYTVKAVVESKTNDRVSYDYDDYDYDEYDEFAYDEDDY